MPMVCYQGEKVSLNGGAPTLFSIGASLGRVVRWLGHYNDPRFYSVLCHNAAVSDFVGPVAGCDGLLHDVQESLMADVPTPMKTKTHRRREQLLLRNIYIVYGIRWPVPEAIEEAIDEADDLMKGAEAYVLKHPGTKEEFDWEVDKDAVRLVRKYAMMGNDFVLHPDLAGEFFEKKFKKAYKAAGLGS